MSDDFERFQKCAVEVLSVEATQVTKEASFADDLDADSLDLVELVMALEEEFDVTVEALNEANAATEGYSSFYVGLNIVIPFIDRIAYKHVLKEIPLDVPPQVFAAVRKGRLTVPLGNQPKLAEVAGAHESVRERLGVAVGVAAERHVVADVDRPGLAARQLVARVVEDLDDRAPRRPAGRARCGAQVGR